MTRRLLFLSLVLVLLGQQGLLAQASLQHKGQTWLGYMTQTRLNERLSLWNDVHWTPDFFLVLRTGLSYHFKGQPSIVTTLGYGHLLIWPSQAGWEHLRPEHRPWGQTVLSLGQGRWSQVHRLRYDARFRAVMVDDQPSGDYDFNWRFRYMVQGRYQLAEPGRWPAAFSLVLANEFLYNVGASIKGGARMDQNRSSVMLAWRHGNITLQGGYMAFLSLAAQSPSYTLRHTGVLWVFHRF